MLSRTSAVWMRGAFTRNSECGSRCTAVYEFSSLRWLALYLPTFVVALLVLIASANGQQQPTSESSVDAAKDSSEPQVVRSVEQIHKLRADELQTGIRVDLECIVLCYEPEWAILFVHDGKSGFYAGDVRGLDLQRGDRIRIRGVLNKNRVPVKCAYEPSDNGIQFPSPKPVEFDWLQSAREDSQFVTIEAQLVGISQEQAQTTLEMRSRSGGRFRALINRSKVDHTELRKWLGKDLRLNGVVGARFDSQNQWVSFQIWLGELSGVSVIDNPDRPKEYPVTPISQMTAEAIAETKSSYFKTKGVMTYMLSPTLGLLQDDYQQLFVEFSDECAVRLDSSYTVSGNLDTSVTPSVLRMAEATPLDERFSPKQDAPQRSVRELIEGDYSGQYVRTYGTYSGTIHSRGQRGFLLKAKGDLLPVFIHNSSLGDVVIGTRIDVAGIWVQQKSLVGFNIGSHALYVRSSGVKVGTQLPWLLMSVLGSATLLTGIAVAWGITLRRQVRIKTEQFLESVASQRRIEEKYANIFIHARVMVITTDARGIITAANPAAIRETGREESSLLGTPVYQLVSVDSKERLMGLLAKAVESDHPCSCEVQFIGRNDSLCPQEVSVWTTHLEGVRSIHLLWHDISERLRIQQQRAEMEQRLQSMQKMESLGVLAGGIAHDFNNLLTVIMGHACILEMDSALHEKVRGGVTSIHQAAQRAAELTQQMLAYAGRGKFDIRVIDMAGLVHELTQLFAATIGKNLLLQIQADKEMPGVKADATQMKQVLMNLVQNASEAMTGKSGKIIVRTFAVDKTPAIDAPDSVAFSFLDESRGVPPSGYVCVEVSDEGMGIEETKMKRIFDPFFTTKFSGRGLGLSTVLGIVKSHHGCVSVHSEVSSGTTFRVYLPTCTGIVCPVPQTHIPHREIKLSARVLVVDDEVPVLKVISEALRNAGIEVDCCESGTQALQAFEGQPDKFDCVITDLTMPELDGLELVSHIRNHNTTVPIVLCSGYTLDSTGQSIQTPGVNATIQKPFQPKDLVTLVHKLVTNQRESTGAKNLPPFSTT